MNLDPALPLDSDRPVVLVIEDSPGGRALLRRTLEAAPLNAVVLEAPHGAAGLKLAMSEQVDCVLCDLEMPVMDGITFLRALRNRFSRLELPVLVITARDGVADKVTGFRCGASDFLTKPFDVEELVARTETHVSLARMHRQLCKVAHTDPLTGLTNRRRFQTVVDAEFSRARRMGRPLSMLMLDIDHFKRVNDTLGHPAGDAVLAGLARVLSATIRAYDNVARLGGEEFAVLLPEVGLPDVLTVAERVRSAVEKATLTPLAPGQVTVSVGVAITTGQDGDNPDQLYARADAQLYRAKQAGRNRACCAET